MQDLPPQPRHEQLRHFFVRRSEPAACGRRPRADGLVLDVFHHVEQHLGRAQIRCPFLKRVCSGGRPGPTWEPLSLSAIGHLLSTLELAFINYLC